MSQSLSAKRLTHIAQTTQTNAGFARITRTDGTVIGLTNHVKDVTIGSVTYLSATGYTPTAVSHSTNYQPGTVDVDAILSTAGIPRADIEAGEYDYADVRVFITDYTNPVADEHPVIRGKWGRVTLQDGRFQTEFHSLLDHLSQNIGRTHKPACDAELGDSDCGVRLDPSTWAATTAYTVREAQDAATGSIVKPTTELGVFFKCTVAGTSGGSEPSWDTTIGNTTTDGTVTWEAFRATTLTGTVTAITDNRVFQDSSRDEPDAYWDYGKVTFTSGANNGLSMEIKSFTYVNGSPGVAEISLFLPMPNDIALSDTYTIVTGCQKRFTEDCVGVYDNADNFRGFPFIPTRDQAARFGGQ